MTFENITIGCGQNCAATRAYCGHAHTEKLKTTASTSPRHAPAVAHRDVVLPDHVVARHHLESGRLEPADQLLAELAVHRLQGTLQVMAAVAEVEDADASLPGLKVG